MLDALTPISSNPHLADLSPFEYRILHLYASGMNRSAIARALKVSPATVSHSLTIAKEKIGASTPIEAVVVLVRRGSL